MDEAYQMKERPILFKGSMVNAILSGRKTQTRRLVKLKAGDRFEEYERGWPEKLDKSGEWEDVVPPCGLPGDEIWVRENWNLYLDSTMDLLPKGKGIPKIQPIESHVVYDADWNDGTPNPWSMHPSIFMPRWASRLALRVEGVRLERIQDISEDDAAAEGAPRAKLAEEPFVVKLATYKKGFRKLWISINGAESWRSNPWVWVYEFERVVK